MAATEGDGAGVARLLAAGADPDAPATAQSPDGAVFQTTPLCEAAANGRLEAARLLLEGGADPGRMAGNGGTPLMAAVEIGLGRIVALYYRSSTLYHIHQHIRCLFS